MNKPDYKRIYSDILKMKFPDKKEIYEKLLFKSNLSSMDVTEINKKIFGKSQFHGFNQKHKSYNQSDILKILDYQKNNKLNNTELAHHFNISRNTITKWRKLFQM
jgi:DNA-binding transcriptional regulator YiaG